MTDRPIIFSAPMIRALIAGRKTQTRRIITGEVPAEPAMDNVHPKNVVRHPAPYLDAYCGGPRTVANPRGMTDRWCWWTRDDRCGLTFKVPYVPGDRLWVRESCLGEELADGQDGVRFAADDAFVPIQSTRTAADAWLALNHYRSGGKRARRGKPVPSIHMPRWASRLTLPVTEVRVERLQDISEADAIAEGMPDLGSLCEQLDLGKLNTTGETAAQTASRLRWPQRWFAGLWNSINGPDAWAANPWVAAVTFEVHSANIDALDAGRAAV